MVLFRANITHTSGAAAHGTSDRAPFLFVTLTFTLAYLLRLRYNPPSGSFLSPVLRSALRNTMFMTILR
jgi:hypothetical protein